MMLFYTRIGIIATSILPPAPLNTLLPAVCSEDMPYTAPLKLYCEQETTRDLLKCRPWVRRFGSLGALPFSKASVRLILLLWKLSSKKQNSRAHLEPTVPRTKKPMTRSSSSVMGPKCNINQQEDIFYIAV